MTNYQNLLTRSRITKSIRDFFHGNGYMEIESPVRLFCPALEDYIDAVPSGKTYGEKMYLRTSPELHLKRFLAESNGTADKVFQIGSCFRLGEIGSQHQEEFTMLEWYRLNADYRDILNEMQRMIRRIVQDLDIDVTFRDERVDIIGNWEVLTVEDAFDRFADISAESAINQDCFEEVLTEQVEPNLGRTKPTFLIDYPASMAALAKLSESNPNVCERWELYIGGLELANCYSELTDAIEQRQRFEKTAELRRNANREVYPIDEAFMKALPKLPNCGGVALGLDRLCMVLTNSDTINEVSFR